MEWADETRLRSLVVSSKDPSHLKSVVAMLREHGIQTEVGLHRAWRSDSFEPSVMVAPEDSFRASVLYRESEIAAVAVPTGVSSLTTSRLAEPGKLKSLLVEFFAKPKQPKPTDHSRFGQNRA